MDDEQLICVDEKVRENLRQFGDLIFDEAPQKEIDAAWRAYKRMKDLQREGVEYVPTF
jgi:hypothetical protein